jgi:hypothetical protein
MLIKESHVDVPTTANGKDSSMRNSLTQLPSLMLPEAHNHD